MGIKFGPEALVSALVLLLIWLFLSSYFTPDLMLSKTTTTGGDMGSHYVIAHYLRYHLLPEGRLMGWYPHWLAGMPMLQYYFVPPYLFMALLSYLIPLEIAFKLGTVLGVFMLPVLVFYAFRLLGFRFPAPLIAASFTLPFLFLESYSQYGGNIKSTLAGQFPHGISFALAFLSIALMYRGMKDKKHLALNAVVLALVATTHIYTTITLAVTYSFLGLESILRRRFQELRYLATASVLAFLLAGFWLVPMIAKFGYNMAPKDVFFGFPDVDQAFVPEFMLFYVLAMLYVFSYAATLFDLVIMPWLKKEDQKQKAKRSNAPEQSPTPEIGRPAVLFYYTIASFLLFLFSNHTNLLYVRFLPALYFMALMFAALGLDYLASGVKAKLLVPVIVAFFIFFSVSTGVGTLFSFSPEIGSSPYLSQGVKDVDDWIRWNYEGLEAKSAYGTFKGLNDYLATLPDTGRVNIEYSAAYNTYGTPRVFEASPIFSNKSVLEALLLESSLTFPFYYYIQKEVSEDAWWPGFPIKIPRRNLSSGAVDMGLYNVKYYVVSSDVVKKEIALYDEYTLLKKIPPFEVYSLNPDSQYIEPVSKEPVLVVTDDWRTHSFKWMVSGHKDVPLVFSNSLGEYELSHFRLIVIDKNIKAPTDQPGVSVYKGDEVEKALNDSKELSACSVNEGPLTEEEISFKTDCIGRPVIAKISYFPNWIARGAGKIYLASPSVMLFYPEQGDIKLFYGTVFPDQIGGFFSIIGLVLVAYLVWSRKRFFTGEEKELGIKLPEVLERVSLPLLAALLVVFVLAAASVFYGYNYVSESGACSSYCASLGYSSGQKSFFGGGVDSYLLGSRNPQGNRDHNLVCTAFCDEGRKQMVYIPSGYVEFDMRVSPNTENTLVLKMWDNANCRSGDLYINNELLTKIRGEGSLGWNDFEFKIPERYLNDSIIRVKLAADDSGCYGWDLSEAHVKAPDCRCYK